MFTFEKDCIDIDDFIAETQIFSELKAHIVSSYMYTFLIYEPI